jgi:uncharacterized protein YjbI with pentapeptide repeats
MPRANFSRAELYEYDLEKLEVVIRKDEGSKYQSYAGTVLSEANLSGADLTAVMFVSQHQIDQANGNDDTRLPQGITLPPSWRNDK